MILEFDFTHNRENNNESEAILEANRDRVNNSCRKVLELLEEGVELTVRSAMLDYNISSLPRRILDLRQKGFDIKDRLIDGRYKVYFL